MKQVGWKSVLAAVLCLCLCLSLLGCTDKEYTIQYTDDAGTHTLTVTRGMPYALESVPYRYGYEFAGLFDAQTGGKQYVGANGASLAPYGDKANKVLFPQWKPIDYTVILDYGEAKITGARSLTVAYGTALPELPNDLTLAHNEFTGWYTEADGKGTQVADAYGNLPLVSVLNEENFTLDDTRRISLYAGFELETYTVTFRFDDGTEEALQVPYDTPIDRVVPKKRNAQGEAVLIWSKTQDGEPFSGNVTEAMTLYAKTWAPVIELSGADVPPIVARAGSAVSLPTPTKPLAKFLHWEDENGETKNITTMPAKSLTLYAVWQGKIEFDENGGTDVDDISQPAGESITLPTPTKDGYLFAGWYTADKEQYTQTKMPSAGIALKAGWYKEKKINHTVWTLDSYGYVNSRSKTYLQIDLKNLVQDIIVQPTMNVKMEIHFQSQHHNYANGDKFATLIIEFYNISERVSNEFIDSFTYPSKKLKEEWQTHDEVFNFAIKNGIAYIIFDITSESGDSNRWLCEVSLRDFYYTIYYPDTTYLYL